MRVDFSGQTFSCESGGKVSYHTPMVNVSSKGVYPGLSAVNTLASFDYFYVISRQ
jgi:hypothetical protein